MQTHSAYHNLFSQVIRVKLLSDLLGPFDETFRWNIRGSSTPLALQFRGHVCGPSFEVDTDVLDFGVVSYGFRCATCVALACARACTLSHCCSSMAMCAGPSFEVDKDVLDFEVVSCGFRCATCVVLACSSCSRAAHG